MPSTKNCKVAKIVASVTPEAVAAKYFPAGRCNLREVARDFGVTPPTARTILITLFGADRLVMQRGRAGGTTLLPPGVPSTPMAPVATEPAEPATEPAEPATVES